MSVRLLLVRFGDDVGGHDEMSSDSDSDSDSDFTLVSGLKFSPSVADPLILLTEIAHFMVCKVDTFLFAKPSSQVSFC